MTKKLALLALAAVAIGACERDSAPTDVGSTDASLQADPNPPMRAVYTITNQVSGNEVAMFTRAADGSLTPAGMFATGGTGTGGGLGSQGAVVLNRAGDLVFAVNAGSNDVSVFHVGRAGLTLTSRTPSGGIRPTSITVHRDLVYVLNAGGDGNISGFTLDAGGGLTPIAGSTQSLSGTATNPAQVEFSRDGRHLIVTEKATNLLDVFAVDGHGVAGERTSFDSPGGTPFGFEFGPRELVVVSEAAAPGSASSYILRADGALQVVSGAVPANQGAPCWVVITRDGRFAYTGNGAGSISGYVVAPNGSISLLDADGVTAVVDGGLNDLALSENSRFLFALEVGDTPEIHTYHIKRDGHLEGLGSVAGLPAGTVGLAAL